MIAAGGAVALVIVVGFVVMLSQLFRGPKPADTSPVPPPTPSLVFDPNQKKVQDSIPPPPIKPEERHKLTTEEIVAGTGPKVARVKGKGGSGSGFMVLSGVLVTNAHVVSDEFANDLEVFFPSATTDKGPFSAVIVYKDEKRDLAFLRLGTSLAPVPLADKFKFRPGMDVTIIGSPGVGRGEVLENAVSRGVLSAKTKVAGQPFYQLSASINPGNSGGPVFDDFGDAIGVASAHFVAKEGLALCIPIEDLKAAVDRVASQSPQDADTAGARHRQQTVSRFLSLISAKFAIGLDLYIAGMDAAIKDNKPPGQGLNAMAQLVDPKLAGLARFCEVKLKPEVAELMSTNSTPPLVKQHLDELWSTYSTMKSTLDEPRGDVNGFKAKASELLAEEARRGPPAPSRLRR